MMKANIQKKDFFYTILSTTYPIETEDLVKQARKSRSITSNHEANNMIEINSTIKNEILSVLNQKGNISMLFNVRLSKKK